MSSPEQLSKSLQHARKRFLAAGGTLRSRDAFSAGIHPRTLYAMREAGLLMPLSRGVYRLTESGPVADPDLAIVAQRVPGAVVCLVSALAFHRLTMEIPHAVDLALPPGARKPRLEHPPIRTYRFGGRSMTEGIEFHLLDGATLRIFSAPKSIADCFKFRNRIGLDIAIESLRIALRTRACSVDELLHYADINRVRSVMMPYIEATL